MKTGKETRRVITIAAAVILLALAFILYSSFTSGNRNPLSDERLDDSMRQALHTLNVWIPQACFTKWMLHLIITATACGK